MTSNLGSHLIQEQLQNLNDDNKNEIMGGIRVGLLDLLKATIRPEFLNRIDEIILFNPLTASDIRKIVDVQLRFVIKRLEHNEIKIKFDDEAKDWLGKAGFDVSYGARPLKRVIQKYITNPLSEKLLSGEFLSGDTIYVKCDKRGEPVFSKTN